MIIEALEVLKTIECDLENVSNVCANKLSNFNYSFGSSKIVIYCGGFVIKKVFGELHSDENNIYRRAREKKLNKFFAITLKYSDDIYIQRKIDIALNDFVKKEKDEGRIIKYGALREDYRKMGLQEMLNRSDCCVLYYLFKQYSLEEILELQNFIAENDLNDLQFYNAGFYNGNIVFFDYSGVNGIFEEEI